ncbi:MAG TPA: polysaccharide deacetylase family protein [Solirubrobacteraceae bacterium]|nr:polysaccharide deacetylase family protein [Solirubrobacteraceae bacterium]
MRLAVAIACVRADAPLARTLGAALAQTSQVTVALSEEALGLEPLALELGASVVHADRLGLAAARNAALTACDAPVLALLDDDACPADGWLEAHTRQWRDPPDDLAIVGGPIVPRITGRRPRWLSDDLLSIFGIVDHGAPSRAIDGTATRLLGGNLSLRVDAAAGLGGFWPMRGHVDLRGWYDSEALLQREASETGWQLGWACDAVTDRLIDGDALTRRGLLARRRRHGALVGAVGNTRRASLASRQAVTSALGVPIALLTASEARVIGRAARTIENTAVLTGGRMASAMLAPTGPTPFRPTVPMPVERASWRRLRDDAAVVLLYHRVDDDHDPLGLSVSRRHFGEHLGVLKGRTVIPLHELADGIRRGHKPRGVAAISFDDGYVDNLVSAAPALESAGLPATVFVATRHVATGAQFGWDIVADALLGPGERPPWLTLELGSRRLHWRTDSARGRRLAHDQIQAWLRALPVDQAEAVVAHLRAWGDQPARASRRPLTVDELGTLAATPGISIGAHSQRHLSLARQDAPTCRAELGGSHSDVADWTGVAPSGIAYPYGVPGEDVDDTTTSHARAAGYDHGVINNAAVVRGDSDPMALPRIAVRDIDGEAFERMLDLAIAGRS